jgi:hypothetical protein
MDGDLDPGAVAGEVLIDGVVEHFRDAVVEGAFVGAADIHARLFADGFEALELAEFGGVVGIGAGVILRSGGGFVLGGHSVGK